MKLDYMWTTLSVFSSDCSVTTTKVAGYMCSLACVKLESECFFWEWRVGMEIGILSLTRDNRSTVVSFHHTNHTKCCNASNCDNEYKFQLIELRCALPCCVDILDEPFVIVQHVSFGHLYFLSIL